MHTFHLTEEHVSSYLRDLASRIGGLGELIPQVWATVGASGSIIAKRLAQLAPDLGKDAEVLFIAYDRAANVVSFPGEENPQGVVQGKRVLLIDGTVHTGGTLLRIVKELEPLRPAAITSYALAVRRGTRIIPNHFGFLIGNHDRVQFPSRVLANNSLSAYGVYRKICDEDANRQMIETGADFLDKVSWEDRLYEMATDPNRHVYLYERDGGVAGFVSFRLSGKTILVDEVGVDVKYRGKGLGGPLMRWAEHCARHRNCTKVELWSVEDKVKFYEHLGYESTGKPALRLSGHRFWKMSKKLLYHLDNDDTLGMGN